MKKGVAIISERKAKILDNAIERAEKYLATLKLVKSGVAERAACAEFNMPFSTFRAWTFYKVSGNDEIRRKEIKEVYVSYQERVYMSAFNCDYEEVPNNADELIDKIFENNLSEREKVIITMRYKDGAFLEEISKHLNVTRERVRQIEAKALRKIKLCIRRSK